MEILMSGIVVAAAIVYIAIKPPVFVQKLLLIDTSSN